MYSKKLIYFLTFILVLGNKSSKAKNSKPLAIFADWIVFRAVDKKTNKLICYTMSLPSRRYDNLNKRGESFFVVFKYAGEKESEIFLSFGQISKKETSNAEINIQKIKFPIMTYEDKGWAYNYYDDKNIIEELLKTPIFSIEIEYNNGQKLIDIYSLNGFTEAYENLLKMCE